MPHCSAPHGVQATGTTGGSATVVVVGDVVGVVTVAVGCTRGRWAWRAGDIAHPAAANATVTAKAGPRLRGRGRRPTTAASDTWSL